MVRDWFTSTTRVAVHEAINITINRRHQLEVLQKPHRQRDHLTVGKLDERGGAALALLALLAALVILRELLLLRLLPCHPRVVGMSLAELSPHRDFEGLVVETRVRATRRHREGGVQDPARLHQPPPVGRVPRDHISRHAHPIDVQLDVRADRSAGEPSPRP